MNNKYEVTVLLSTYNGSKFISELMDSLEAQKGVKFQIVIRDDGSKDDTIKIIKEYQKDYDNITLIEGDNLGAKKSFMQLATMELSSDYYAFCDQDDIWDSDKLCSAVRALKRCGIKDVPLLYYCETRLVDGDKNIICESTNYGKPYTFGQLLVKNHVPGCTMVFNKTLKDQIVDMPYESYMYMPFHDHWIYIICKMLNGRVFYDSAPHISYRQHGNNTVGDRSLVKIIKESGLFDNQKIRSNRAKILLSLYQNSVSSKAKNKLRIISEYDKSLQNKLHLLMDKEIKPKSQLEIILFYLLITLGRI